MSFTAPDSQSRIHNLLEIYSLLKTKQVPFVDRIHDEYSTVGKNYLLLSPRGLDGPPKDLVEVFRGVNCVIGALKVRRVLFKLIDLRFCCRFYTMKTPP